MVHLRALLQPKFAWQIMTGSYEESSQSIGGRRGEFGVEVD